MAVFFYATRTILRNVLIIEYLIAAPAALPLPD